MPWATPEEAALAGFDPRYAKVVDVRYLHGGQFADVELATNEPPYLYPYWVLCERVEGGWVDKLGGNGPHEDEGVAW